jgi:hypothetical protein
MFPCAAVFQFKFSKVFTNVCHVSPYPGPGHKSEVRRFDVRVGHGGVMLRRTRTGASMRDRDSESGQPHTWTATHVNRGQPHTLTSDSDRLG